MIQYDAERRTITLHTRSTSYQMKIDATGVLLHTYYGEKLRKGDLSQLICPEVLFILSRTGHRPEILHRFADGGIVPESRHFCVEFVNLGFEFVLTSPALSDGLI